MSKTAEGLSKAYEYKTTSPEDLVFDLFKVQGAKDEASIGKLISVRLNVFSKCYIMDLGTEIIWSQR